MCLFEPIFCFVEKNKSTYTLLYKINILFIEMPSENYQLLNSMKMDEICIKLT